MKKELLQKLIDDNTIDGVVDYDAVFKAVDKSINDTVKSNKVNVDEIKANAMKEATKKVMESLKIEADGDDTNIDDIGKKVQDKLDSLTTGLKEINDKYEQSSQKNIDLELTNKVSKYAQKNHQFAKLKYQEYKTPENTDEDVYKLIDEEYPEWDANYKSTKGNALLDDNKFETTDVDKMFEALGVVKIT